MSRVLLIEPDRVLAKTYHQALMTAGHVVQTCGSAQSAIIMADSFDPEVVVLELQLVSHSGAEFLYEFRSYADWQSVPVLVHTNISPTRFTGSFAVTQKQLGINQYLYKPLTTLRDLLRAVDTVKTQAIA